MWACPAGHAVPSRQTAVHGRASSGHDEISRRRKARRQPQAVRRIGGRYGGGAQNSDPLVHPDRQGQIESRRGVAHSAGGHVAAAGIVGIAPVALHGGHGFRDDTQLRRRGHHGSRRDGPIADPEGCERPQEQDRQPSRYPILHGGDTGRGGRADQGGFRFRDATAGSGRRLAAGRLPSRRS